jgi:hypothetical protein
MTSWIVAGTLFVLLVVVSYFMIKFAVIILQVQDAIEDSLDILDKNHASISKVIATPLFHDSPEIRRVLTDIESARASVLSVATTLTKIDDTKEFEDDNI